VQIVDLPGVAMDPEVRGQKAYHLLSAMAVARYAQAHANALDLPPAYREADPQMPEPRRALPRLVEASMARDAAQAIARRLGRNLGHILVALHRGDAVNRAARADWTDAAWARWATIRTVWIGGGLMSGELGAQVVRHARRFLAEAGYAAQIAVGRTPRPQKMALLGAARYLPAAPRRGLCLDFGSTSVKRARFDLAGGAIVGAGAYPQRPVPWAWRNDPSAGDDLAGGEVLDFVADTLAETLEEDAGKVAVSTVPVSFAAYVRGGKLLGNGIYARMMQVTSGDDVRPRLAEAIHARTGRRVHIRPIHDGTAAAALHAGESGAAVLVIGTAIGVGFPPPRAAGLRPYAAKFEGIAERETGAT
jgi:hypothetical protein